MQLGDSVRPFTVNKMFLVLNIFVFVQTVIIEILSITFEWMELDWYVFKQIQLMSQLINLFIVHLFAIMLNIIFQYLADVDFVDDHN